MSQIQPNSRISLILWDHPLSWKRINLAVPHFERQQCGPIQPLHNFSQNIMRNTSDQVIRFLSSWSTRGSTTGNTLTQRQIISQNSCHDTVVGHTVSRPTADQARACSFTTMSFRNPARKLRSCRWDTTSAAHPSKEYRQPSVTKFWAPAWT